MPEMPVELWLAIIVCAAMLAAGQTIVHGVEQGAHKAKCGVMRVVGKHCAPMIVVPVVTPEDVQ